jgi:hypothetical protein
MKTVLLSFVLFFAGCIFIKPIPNNDMEIVKSDLNNMNNTLDSLKTTLDLIVQMQNAITKDDNLTFIGLETK